MEPSFAIKCTRHPRYNHEIIGIFFVAGRLIKCLNKNHSSLTYGVHKHHIRRSDLCFRVSILQPLPVDLLHGSSADDIDVKDPDDSLVNAGVGDSSLRGVRYSSSSFVWGTCVGIRRSSVIPCSRFVRKRLSTAVGAANVETTCEKGMCHC